MTIQFYTVEMQTAYFKAAHYYLERASQWPSVVPTNVIPEKRYVEFVKTPQPEPPKLAMDWASHFPTGIVMQKYEVMVPSIHQSFSYDDEQIKTTADWGLPVIDRQVNTAYRQLDRRAAQLVYQGDVAGHHQGASDLQGLTNVSSPSGLNTSTYNTIKWNASGGPQATIRNMAATLEADSLDAPFALVLGSGTQTGLWTTISSTAEYNLKQVNEILTSPGSVQVGNSTANMVFEDKGTDSGNVVYPLPAATTADNVGLLLKPNPDYYQALIARPPFMQLDKAPALQTNKVGGKVGMMMTIIIPEPKAICFHDRIDYA